MGTEGGRVRFSVESKPKVSGGTGRARKDGHRKQPSEKNTGRVEVTWARPVPGPRGRRRGPVCEGWGAEGSLGRTRWQ